MGEAGLNMCVGVCMGNDDVWMAMSYNCKVSFFMLLFLIYFLFLTLFIYYFLFFYFFI